MTPMINFSWVINFIGDRRLIRGFWGCQNYFKPKRRNLILPASEASDHNVWSAYGCKFLWRFQWHHRPPCPTSAAGDITNLSPSTFSYPWQLPTSMASLILSPANNCSPVLLSPAIIVHQCCWHRWEIYRWYQMTPVIIKNPWHGLFVSVNDTGDKFIAGVVDTGEQLIAGVNDTGNNSSLMNICANFRKN